MADETQVKILDQGISAWNTWRDINTDIKIDLSGIFLRRHFYSGVNFANANLKGSDLSGRVFLASNLSGAILDGCAMDLTDFSNSNLSCSSFLKADLSHSKFENCNLSNTILSDTNLYSVRCTNANFINSSISYANLRYAELNGANFSNSNLSHADLTKAIAHGADFTNCDLSEANLNEVDFTDANLSGTDLQYCSLVKTIIERAILTECKVFGISVWDLQGNPKDQKNLVITYQDRYSKSRSDIEITVDDLKMAQFIYLIVNNKNIRDVIDTLTTKVVLILGRFTEERKVVLDTIHKELRAKNYLPVLFDFKGPETRDITETISTLAHLARFVIADITDAKSIPQELQVIVPFLPSVPIIPILEGSKTEYGMFEHFKRYPWVLKTYVYKNIDEVISSVSDKIILPLEKKLKKLVI